MRHRACYWINLHSLPSTTITNFEWIHVGNWEKHLEKNIQKVKCDSGADEFSTFIKNMLVTKLSKLIPTWKIWCTTYKHSNNHNCLVIFSQFGYFKFLKEEKNKREHSMSLCVSYILFNTWRCWLKATTSFKSITHLCKNGLFCVYQVIKNCESIHNF